VPISLLIGKTTRFVESRITRIELPGTVVHDFFRGGWCWEEVIFALTGSYKKKLTTHPPEVLIMKVPEHRLRRTL